MNRTTSASIKSCVSASITYPVAGIWSRVLLLRIRLVPWFNFFLLVLIEKENSILRKLLGCVGVWTCSKQLLPWVGKPHSYSRSIICTNPISTAWMRYCNCCDITFIYSLNSWKLLGSFLEPGCIDMYNLHTVTFSVRLVPFCCIHHGDYGSRYPGLIWVFGYGNEFKILHY